MVITHLNGMFGENCYLYINERTGEALAVDPGYEMDRIFSILRDYTLTHIFITHGHIDHIAGLKELKEAFPTALICGHAHTLRTLPDPQENLSFRWEEPVAAPPPDWTYSGNEGALEACGQKWACYYTPGHAYDHSVFLGEDKTLFGGDVIFEGGSFGRYDLPGCSFDDLKNSLTLILHLPLDTLVYPGHGGNFTVEEARPHFRSLL